LDHVRLKVGKTTQLFDGAKVKRIVVDGGDGDDRIDADDSIRVRMTVNGGMGDDWITGGHRADVINGGAGNDFLDGGRGDDLVNGDDDQDELIVTSGRDLVHGGTGNDVLVNQNSAGNEFFGDAGTDLIIYESRSDLRISLDDRANDGALGENDNVH